MCGKPRANISTTYLNGRQLMPPASQALILLKLRITAETPLSSTGMGNIELRVFLIC